MARRRDPAFAETDSELFERPGHLIRRCYQIIVALYLKEVEDVGLTQLQYLVLRMIKRHPRQSQRWLGESAGLDRTTVGWIVANLAAKGLLRRDTDAADRRHKRLEITPKGLEKLELVEPGVKRVQRRIVAPLEPEERKNFVLYLQKIVNEYNAYSRAPLRIDGPHRKARASLPKRS